MSYSLTYRDRLRGFLSSRSFVPLCFLVYVLLRVLVMVLLPVMPTSDGAWYLARGLQLAAGGGYAESGIPTAYWPVGYPGFLGLVFYFFGPNVIAAELANLVLSCGIFFFTYYLARVVFADSTVGRAAVLVLTFYPNQIAYTGVVLSEMLVTFSLMLGIVLFVRHRDNWQLFGSALAFGVASLVKAQALLVGPILLALEMFRSRAVLRWLPAGVVVVLGVACVILPWSARNYLVLHRFVLISTNGGATFLSGNNPEAQGDFTPESPLFEAAHFSVADQVDADKRAYALAVNWIEANPRRFVELIPLKIWRLWAPDGEGEWWFERGYAGYDAHRLSFRLMRGLNQAYYVALLLAAGAAVWELYASGEARRPGATIGFWLAIYITMVSIVFSGQSRFHFPVMPWVCIYAGWFATRRLAVSQPQPQN